MTVHAGAPFVAISLRCPLSAMWGFSSQLAPFAHLPLFSVNVGSFCTLRALSTDGSPNPSLLFFFFLKKICLSSNLTVIWIPLLHHLLSGITFMFNLQTSMGLTTQVIILLMSLHLQILYLSMHHLSLSSYCRSILLLCTAKLLGRTLSFPLLSSLPGFLSKNHCILRHSLSSVV